MRRRRPRLRAGRDAGGREGLAFLGLDAKKHETLPPARYTEAALIKELEAAGIGRPSTYASIIQTIQNRGYVFRQGKALVPSFTAFAVTELLRLHFTDYVDVGFTAEMEEVLDAISNGEREWLDFVRTFYRGDERARRAGDADRAEAERRSTTRAIDVGVDPGTDQPIRVRIGRYGPFLQRGEGGEGNTASLPDDLPPADLTVEHARPVARSQGAGPAEPRRDPASGLHVYVIVGRFGAYVQLGDVSEKSSKAQKPRRASFFAGMSEKTITLDEALSCWRCRASWARIPDGEVVMAGQGRFGPYVKHGDEFRSLERPTTLFTVDAGRGAGAAGRAEEVARAASAARTVLKEVGTHPRERRDHQPAGGPLRSVRHRRHDQRVAAQEHGRPNRSRSNRRWSCWRRAKARRRRAAPWRAAAARRRRLDADTATQCRATVHRPRQPCTSQDEHAHVSVHMVRIIGGGLGGVRGGVAGRQPRRAGHAVRDAPGAADRGPQDRPAGRTGLQQLLPRRQARQRRRTAQRRDAAARARW